MDEGIKKRILLISYYWPPAGGGGVQRWLKMTKYLPEMGFDITVYTPENGEAPVLDASLEKEIHPNLTMLKTPIWEPYSWYKKFTGRKKSEKVYSGFISDKKESFTQKLSVFIRGNFFIPDARKFWIKPSVEFLVEHLKKNPVDAIISTGPPHSMHLIALGVTKKLPIPWIADFRDPWTNIDFYDQLRLTSQADKKHRSLEKQVLKHATKIVTVSKSWSQDFKRLSDRNDIEIITNGFDAADFTQNLPTNKSNFTICHIGSMNKDRNPNQLWKVIHEMIEEGTISQLQIKLIGQVDHQIFESLQQNELMSFTNHIPFMPHDEVVKEISKTTILLLPINDTPNSAGVIPGKLFEYMGSGRPILGIGPVDGDSAEILRTSSAGVMIDYDDMELMKSTISTWYAQFKNGGLEVQSVDVQKYSRESLAKEYAQLLNKILS